MKNSQYWENRINEIAKLQYDRANEAEKEIIKAYNKAERYIEERIRVYYSKYALNNGISLLDSEKLLSASELDNFKMTLEEFIQKAQNNEDNRWTRELEKEYLRSRISRLNALKLEVNNKIKELKHEQLNITTFHLKNTYMDTYYRTAYEIEKGTGVGLNFAKLNDTAIEKSIYSKWLDDKNFTGRLNDDKISLMNNLNKVITQGLIIGSSSDEMVKKLMKATKTSRRRAISLIQTETAFVIGQANTEMYKELGVEEYECIETLDKVTCDFCGMMDGKRFKLSDKKEGENAPPFHVNCRGTTVPVSKFEHLFKGGMRVARNDDGDIIEIPANMKYNEWKAKYIENDINESTNLIPKFKGKIMNLPEQIYTDDEIKQIAQQSNEILDKHINISSKWSGKIEIDNQLPSGKLWNCDIRTSNITSPYELLHEQIHARSISYYDVLTYKEFHNIEEASVELLAQEISRLEKIKVIPSEYDDLTNNLRNINKIVKIEKNDFEFAKTLINIPVAKRIDFIENCIYNYLQDKTIDDAIELNKLMEVFYGK